MITRSSKTTSQGIYCFKIAVERIQISFWNLGVELLTSSSPISFPRVRGIQVFFLSIFLWIRTSQSYHQHCAQSSSTDHGQRKLAVHVTSWDEPESVRVFPLRVSQHNRVRVTSGCTRCSTLGPADRCILNTDRNFFKAGHRSETSPDIPLLDTSFCTLIHAALAGLYLIVWSCTNKPYKYYHVQIRSGASDRPFELVVYASRPSLIFHLDLG